MAEDSYPSRGSRCHAKTSRAELTISRHRADTVPHAAARPTPDHPQSVAASHARPSPLHSRRRKHRSPRHPAPTHADPAAHPTTHAAHNASPAGRAKTRHPTSTAPRASTGPAIPTDTESRVCNCRWPNTSQFFPRAPTASRSCMNARNGATPVPGPIMIIGRCGSAGSRKCRFGLTNTFNRSPALRRSAKSTEATPDRARDHAFRTAQQRPADALRPAPPSGSMPPSSIAAAAAAAAT